MKLHFALSTLSVVAMLAAAPSAMAATATVGATTDAMVGTTGTNTTANATASADGGVSALGVNISTAGDTSTSVHAFTSTLTTEQQANIQAGCKAAMAHPGQASADVLAFCKNSVM